jgi:hypothetical protein
MISVQHPKPFPVHLMSQRLAQKMKKAKELYRPKKRGLQFPKESEARFPG